tara:strand:- start:108 stop:587 length:480 start_codon:yes stop_codon:yes gene_type:complete
MAIITLNNNSLSSVTSLPAGVGGKVLQVVFNSYSTYSSTSAGSYVDFGLSATITPSSSSSKILVISDTQNPNKSGSNDVWVKLQRNIGGGSYSDLAEFGKQMCWNQGTAENRLATSGGSYLDTPSTTSACIYKIQFKSGGGELNSNGSLSTLTLMEISG